jgi:carbon storage regulator
MPINGGPPLDSCCFSPRDCAKLPGNQRDPLHVALAAPYHPLGLRDRQVLQHVRVAALRLCAARRGTRPNQEILKIARTVTERVRGLAMFMAMTTTSDPTTSFPDGVQTMLVLSRKCTETIVLPTLGITIDLLEIKGNRVRIGIDAPAEIPVYRQEVADRLRAQEAVETRLSDTQGEQALLAAS